jgi:transposase InsO family protein
MNVTHFPALGKLQYVHVSIDISSGVLHASPLTGEKAVHVISHCLEEWAAWGKPLVLKTDNGHAYTSKFSQFCKQMQVKHITGLPYNPQGQGIIERAHCTLKQYLQKQKGGIEAMTPKMALHLTIFTLNFF